MFITKYDVYRFYVEFLKVFLELQPIIQEMIRILIKYNSNKSYCMIGNIGKQLLC